MLDMTFLSPPQMQSLSRCVVSTYLADSRAGGGVVGLYTLNAFDP
jgi:hypothetical protein